MPHDDQVNQDQSRDHGGEGRREAANDGEDHHDHSKPPRPAPQVEESDADSDPYEAEHQHDRPNHARGQAETERQAEADEDQRRDNEQEPCDDDQDAQEDREDREESDADRPRRRRIRPWRIVTGRGSAHSRSPNVRTGTLTTSLRREFQNGEHLAPRTQRRGDRIWKRTEGVRRSVVRRPSSPPTAEASTVASWAGPCPGPLVPAASRRYRESR